MWLARQASSPDVRVSIDTASPTPVYEQLRSQIQRLIASGQLPVGARLPTIRQLAADLGLASATVSRVYELLAHDGWVVGAGRRGTVVQARAPSSTSDEEVRAAVEYLALLARQVGLSRSAVDRLLDDALAQG
jgi:DNA-binding transcriptional regulator YhcF (GntR family)